MTRRLYTSEDVLEAIREWRRRFGRPPSALNWNRAQCRALHRHDLLALYESTGHDWPSVSTVQSRFGSWANAIEAAGFDRPTAGTEYGQRYQPELAAFFVSRLPGLDPSVCWPWQGTMTTGGYGELRLRGTRVAAHRFAHQYFLGPIPDGFEVDHLCRNPACVNPNHLEAVAPLVNLMRSSSPSAINARKTHCNRGHALEGENVMHTPSGRECRTCKRLYSNAARDARRALKLYGQANRVVRAEPRPDPNPPRTAA